MTGVSISSADPSNMELDGFAVLLILASAWFTAMRSSGSGMRPACSFQSVGTDLLKVGHTYCATGAVDDHPCWQLLQWRISVFQDLKPKHEYHHFALLDARWLVFVGCMPPHRTPRFPWCLLAPWLIFTKALWFSKTIKGPSPNSTSESSSVSSIMIARFSLSQTVFIL